MIHGLEMLARPREDREPCLWCGEPAFVVIDDTWLCREHLEEGVRTHLRLMALSRGFDPDEVELAGVEMLHDLLEGLD